MKTSPTTPAHSFALWTFAALAAILAVAAALRVHGLSNEGAWLDEAFAIGIARNGLDDVFYETRLDVHPPLYYVLLTGWLTITGPSVWAARLLSVICSLGVIAAGYLAASRLGGRVTGLATAALLAVSPFQIEFAQEARMYALLALVATLSTWSLERLVGSPRFRWWFVYVAATALMVWTHVYALFIIAAQALAVVADSILRRPIDRDTLGKFVSAQAAVFVTFLPWLPVFTWQFSLVQTSFWIARPEPLGLFGAFRTYAGSPQLLYLLLPLFALGLVHLWREGTKPGLSRPPLFFVLPWLVGPILLPFVLSLVSSPIFLPKYTIAASVPFAIVTAAGIAALPFSVLRIAVLAGCMAVSLRLLPAYYDVATKDGWRDAVPIVETLASRDDAVVVYPYFNKIAYDFYRTRSDIQVRAMPLYGEPPPEDGWPVTLQRATAGRDRIWLVTLAADPTARVALEAINGDFVLSSHQVRQKIAIYRYDRRR